ncbi:acyl-CoA dehydrogenase family protein [Nocardia sp. NPDC055053]
MIDTTQDDTDQFADAVDEYLATSYDGDRRRQILESADWDVSFSRELVELGWYSLAVPEEHGGLGAGLDALGPVFTQLGRHLVTGPQLESFLLPALLPLVVGPSDVVALVDPGVTHDWRAEFGSVTLTDGRLDGVANAVRFAQQATLLLVVAATESGEVLCVVDPAAPGVRVTDADSADPATVFGKVTLHGVEAQALSGERADSELVTRLRAWTRLLIACELGGLAHRSLELTVKYVAHREQFGRPVGSFQAVKHIAADMHATWAGVDSLCRAAVADARRASLDDLELLGMTAKAHAAEAAIRVCEMAIQLHGGVGFTAEADVSWYYRRALSLRAWYGDAEELQRQIGAAVLNRPRSGRHNQDPQDN